MPLCFHAHKPSIVAARGSLCSLESIGSTGRIALATQDLYLPLYPSAADRAPRRDAPTDITTTRILASQSPEQSGACIQTTSCLLPLLFPGFAVKMSSTRERRIAKELNDIHQDKDNSGVYAAPVDPSNLTHLKGTFPAPPDTPYAGGTYTVDIQIPDMYPFKSPVMKFDTKIWHPNISSQTVSSGLSAYFGRVTSSGSRGWETREGLRHLPSWYPRGDPSSLHISLDLVECIRS